jgi:hypothetical protein
VPTATKPKADEVYVCIQSFAGNELSVAEGLRLSGNNEIVRRFPDRFVIDGTPDDEIAKLRTALEEPASPPKPLGRVRLRVLPGLGPRGGGAQTVTARGRVYQVGEELEAEGANAQHLLDSGCVEIVRHLRTKETR